MPDKTAQDKPEKPIEETPESEKATVSGAASAQASEEKEAESPDTKDPEKETLEEEASDTQESETEKPEEEAAKNKASAKDENSKQDEKIDVPTVDPNASLKIDELTVKPKKAEIEIEESFAENGEENKLEKRNKKIYILGSIIAVLVIISVAALLFFYVGKLFAPEKKEPPKDEKKVVKEEKPTLDKPEWTIEVLNGSGVPGAAKEVADQLTEAGYTVVSTGNAQGYDYEESELLVAEDMIDKADLLKEDIKDIIDISGTAGELDDSTASARIIIGKE